MFRHKNIKKEKEEVKNKEKNKDVKKSDDVADNVETKKESNKNEVSDDGIKELLEKNLKWSQIIYEQNRRLNHKLIWSAVAGWLRLVLIVAPLILAFFYLSPFVKKVWESYNSLLGIIPQSTTNTQNDSLKNLFNVFNLNKAQQEQVKSVLK